MPNNITFTGDLGKPATTLIEKVSDAIGGIAKPWQIKRVASAEAKAEIIHAEARIKIGDLERRAIERMVQEEARKQENIENITYKAAEKISNNSDPGNLDNDWITYFFDHCRSVSDGDMQDLWSRILAAESEHSGSYSRQTIDLLSKIDKNDAQLMQALFNFSFSGIVYVKEANDPIYQSKGLNFSKICDLESLGIIQFNSLSGYKLNQKDRVINIIYFNNVIQITLKDDPPALKVGQVLLTRTEKELIGLTEKHFDVEFMNYFMQSFADSGLNPTSASN